MFEQKGRASLEAEQRDITSKTERSIRKKKFFEAKIYYSAAVQPLFQKVCQNSQFLFPLFFSS